MFKIYFLILSLLTFLTFSAFGQTDGDQVPIYPLELEQLNSSHLYTDNNFILLGNNNATHSWQGVQEGSSYSIWNDCCFSSDSYYIFSIALEYNGDILSDQEWLKSLSLDLIREDEQGDEIEVIASDIELLLDGKQKKYRTSWLFDSHKINNTNHLDYALKVRSMVDTNVESILQDINLVVFYHKFIGLEEGDRVTETFTRKMMYDEWFQTSSANNEFNINVTPEKLNIAWIAKEGATYYDLEWIFVENDRGNSTTSTNTLYNSLTKNLSKENKELFDLAHKVKDPARVRIIETYYKLGLQFPNGIFLLRVRPITQFSSNLSQTLEGDWIYNKYVYKGNFEASFNWQRVTSFAEEGKHKTVVSYMDAVMRSRQSVVNYQNNDHQSTLVSEQFYDLQGRPTVSTLPVPATDALLTYKQNFNHFGNLNNASLDHVLHYEGNLDRVITDETGAKIYPLSTLDGGTSNYYSPNIDEYQKGGLDEEVISRIPDAEGYAYTTNEYSQDHFGRVKKSIGLTKERTTVSKFYAKPTQDKLNLLFGPNAGYASHYHKEVTSDPNGQLSVNYRDQGGKVVATALAGGSPSSVSPLLLQPHNSIVNDAARKYLNVGIESGEEIKVVNTILLTEGSELEIDYSFDEQAFQTLLGACYECSYTLTFDLVNPIGSKIDLSPEDSETLSKVIVIDGLGNVSNCNAVNKKQVAVARLSGLKELGDYVLTKTLSLNNERIITQILSENVDARFAEITADLRNNVYSDEIAEALANCDAAYDREIITPPSPEDENGNLKSLSSILVSYMQADNEGNPSVAMQVAQMRYPDCDALESKEELSKPEQIEYDKCSDKNDKLFFQWYFNTDDNVYQSFVFDVAVSLIIEGISDENKASAYTSYVDGILANDPYFKAGSEGAAKKGEFEGKLEEIKNDIANNLSDPTVMSPSDRLPYFFGMYINEKRKIQFLIKADDTSLQSTGFLTSFVDFMGDVMKESNTKEDWLNEDTVGGDVDVEGQDILGPPSSINDGRFDRVLLLLGNSCLTAAENYESAVYFTAAEEKAIREVLFDYFSENYSSADPYFDQFIDIDILKAYFEQKSELTSVMDCLFPEPTTDEEGNPVETESGFEYIRRNSSFVTAVPVQRGINVAALNFQGLTDENDQLISPHYYIPDLPGDRSSAKDFSVEFRLSVSSTDTENRLLMSNLNVYPNNGFEVQIINRNNVKYLLVRLSTYRGYEIPLQNSSGKCWNYIGIYRADNKLRVTQNGANLYECDITDGDISLNYFDRLWIGGGPRLGSFGTKPFKGLLSDLSFWNASQFYLEEGDPNYTLIEKVKKKNFQKRMNEYDGINLRSKALLCYFPFNNYRFDDIANTNTEATRLVAYAIPDNLEGEEEDGEVVTDVYPYIGEKASTCNASIGQIGIFIPYKDPFTFTVYEYKTTEGSIWDTSEGTFLGDLIFASLDQKTLRDNCKKEVEDYFNALIEDEAKVLLNAELNAKIREAKQKCINNVGEQLYATLAEKEYHYTLYYYDQSGNLIQTVPPEGVHFYTLNTSGSPVNASEPHTLRTKYGYNSLNQLVWQYTPDAGLTRFVYDQLGRLRFSQNALQLEEGTLAYSKFDEHGRVVEAGKWFTGAPAIDALTLEQVQDNTVPSVDLTSEKINTYYGNIEALMTLPHVNIPESYKGQYLKNRVAWVKAEGTVENNEGVSITLYDYDPHGNVTGIYQSIPAPVTNGITFKSIEYRYDLISGNVNKVYYEKGTADQFVHLYEYDADNRLKEVKTSTNDLDWVEEATYVYFPHGPLAEVILGQYNVQSIDYYYTLHGWIKGVNLAEKEHDNTALADAFSYGLDYHNGDYKSIQALTYKAGFEPTKALAENQSLYNGNIARMRTNLAHIEEVNSGTPTLSTMNYHYDQLHRIISAKQEGGLLASAYSYDAVGNLQTLSRTNGAGEKVHELSYSYNKQNGELQNNKLRKVANASTVTSEEYVFKDQTADDNYIYDAIGNLVMDKSEKVRIHWNIQGKVDYVDHFENDINLINNTHRTQRVRYRYDASGNRISKIIEKTGASPQETQYIRDASGNTMAVIVDASVHEIPIYGSQRLGEYAPISGVNPWSLSLTYKRYELSNHLGNVLTTISDAGNVLSYSDYYPFGASIAGRSWSLENGKGYRYGFNGKENDTDLSSSQLIQDYGFRVYNPTIGKFLSVDPLTKSYPELTPYQFASNSPIAGVDLDGLEFYFAADGSFIKVVGNNPLIRVVPKEDVKFVKQLQSEVLQLEPMGSSFLSHTNSVKSDISKTIYTQFLKLDLTHLKGSQIVYGEESDDALASYRDKTQTIQIYYDEQDNIYNLMALLLKEETHTRDRILEETYNYVVRELNGYERVLKNKKLFSKTSDDFKKKFLSGIGLFIWEGWRNTYLTYGDHPGGKIAEEGMYQQINKFKNLGVEFDFSTADRKYKKWTEHDKKDNISVQLNNHEIGIKYNGKVIQ
ncbi:RHS repeat-associated core domain-containing protein [Flammeovirga sp. SJP92]|uniref:RHS repeat-associated core domain-containing protein n=1 Tax=Flammeovirga sp. SJP92 TaxID=1775430 RepID=UPI00078783D9|nr:RHS repeat-associated core domain-containing protein [Flammeovirga sp. SJP92]KXX67802.1 hypothetical protein AVL50_25405 [Flammeovirga sp. SJP92]